MCSRTCCISAIVVTWLNLTFAAVAQTPSESLSRWLQTAFDGMHIEAISGNSQQLRVTGSRTHAGPRQANIFIQCKSVSQFAAELAIQDLAQKTDDRMKVDPAFCPLLLETAERHRAAATR